VQVYYVNKCLLWVVTFGCGKLGTDYPDVFVVISAAMTGGKILLKQLVSLYAYLIALHLTSRFLEVAWFPVRSLNSFFPSRK
jgi:hypothetical protein